MTIYTKSALALAFSLAVIVTSIGAFTVSPPRTRTTRTTIRPGGGRRITRATANSHLALSSLLSLLDNQNQHPPVVDNATATGELLLPTMQHPLHVIEEAENDLKSVVLADPEYGTKERNNNNTGVRVTYDSNVGIKGWIDGTITPESKVFGQGAVTSIVQSLRLVFLVAFALPIYVIFLVVPEIQQRVMGTANYVPAEHSAEGSNNEMSNSNDADSMKSWFDDTLSPKSKVFGQGAVESIIQSLRLISLVAFAVPLYVILLAVPDLQQQMMGINIATTSAPASDERKAIKSQPVLHDQKQQHKEGLFSPIVKVAKAAMGEAELNKLRGNIIEMHSNVIKSWVDTYDTQLGRATLKSLFQAADTDRNGTIDELELERALRALGFDFLRDKQMHGIFARADANKNGSIDMEEFMQEAPKVLRTNLMKLAKKNGGDMGLLV